MITFFFLLCHAASSFSSAAAFLPAHHVHLRHHSTSPSALSISAKTLDEDRFIKRSLLDNSLFAGIPEDSFQRLVGAFEQKNAERGEIIVAQGDSCNGGYVYLVSEGSCRVLVDNVTVPEPYGIIGENTIFGELGILYEETRAATILVESNSLTYYQIAGDLFKAALRKSSKYTMVSLEKMQEIDEVINRIEGTQALYGGKVIPQYQPERTWLWQQFSGTVLEISLETTLLSMLGCAMFIVFAKANTNQSLWMFNFTPPDKNLPFIQNLSEIKKIWEIQKTLTTFVLTFFVNRCFNFWTSVYQLAREVQGKLSGFQLLLSTNVNRKKDGSLTPESEKFLDEVGQFTRLFHVLFWASMSKRFSVLMSDEGLKRMSSRGLITPEQLEVLLSLDLPNDQLFSAPLEWMMIRSNQAVDEGDLKSDTAIKGALLKEFYLLRNAFTKLDNTIEGRMPLAYVQFVQILVDTFVIISPAALYPDMGDYSVIAVALVALFYAGLNNLAKIFLDPLNNEAIYENAIYFDLGVIIREANGDSTKWKKAATKLPFSSKPT